MVYILDSILAGNEATSIYNAYYQFWEKSNLHIGSIKRKYTDIRMVYDLNLKRIFFFCIFVVLITKLRTLCMMKWYSANVIYPLSENYFVKEAVNSSTGTF